MKKAQISVDLLIIMSIALIMFMFFFKIASDKTQQFEIQSSQLYAKELTEKVAQEIRSAYLGGDGYVKRVNLPSSLMNNRDYSLNFYPDYFLLEINYSINGEDSRYASFIPTARISGNLSNINQPITIMNENGAILILK